MKIGNFMNKKIEIKSEEKNIFTLISQLLLPGVIILISMLIFIN